MKKTISILSFSALTLFSCGGGTKQNQTTETTAENTTPKEQIVEPKAEQPKEKPKPPEPYSVDNFSGKYIDFSKPVLITRKDDLAGVCEYFRYDGENRIIEYGCLTGQYDYEGYIRMFKIHYNGEKIDFVEKKEVYANLVDEKKDLIFKKDVSIFDKITGENIGFTYEADKNVKTLDPNSIASMRKYAESQNDILYRQFGPRYDFSDIDKWTKEKRDDQGRLTYSEIVVINELTDTYKITYSYGEDFVKKSVKLNQKGEFEGDEINSDWKYNLTEQYLHTDIEPKESSTQTAQNQNIAEKAFKKLYPDIKSCSGDNLSYEGFYEEESEGCNAGAMVHCFPLKTDGYLVISKNFFSGPGCAADYWYGTYIFKNGTLDTIKANFLPTPKLEQLLNKEKVADYKAQIAEFKTMYDKAPMNYLYYTVDNPTTLKVSLYPWDCEDAICDMDKSMLNYDNGDKVPEYTWDGEKFVKQ
ncbi:MAG: hypothetical protein II937_06590 [Bacteroidales bacterium]|nr:hypothetical protein [Bacteroidales bacterium]